ncbi:MAG: hypothetical protein ACT4PW_12890 [Acidimicrobiia bacterium]
MERQLALIEEPSDWRLDEHTRQAGREGVAKAREALRQARQHQPQGGAQRPSAA